MSYYLTKYFQSTASYEAYQNKQRLLAWELRKFKVGIGTYKPVKIN